ncbi:hypothetical protein GO755_09130 [Spirosoma sp. HMF4905]|uniref:DUF4369 domain-containing protein n=1 Tax=Spirosoma arboris TaxID=2682092 RepID=A0A7K1S8W4_9BACT|nr:hypothetical protein [Spirosoma arboris]MVM30195.1 hypothetical protein [Spirosoma arboris]
MKLIAAITVALFSMATISRAQVHHTAPSTVYIPVNQSPSIDYKYHDGTALLIDGTILQGRFQFNGRSSFIYRASSQAPKMRIGFSMIRRLGLAGADTLVTDRTDSTVFVRQGHHLFRQLANGSIVVLDQKFAVDEERGIIGRKLYVLDDNSELYKFTSLQKLNRWFYAYKERSGKKLPDVYLNKNEIVKAVAQLNDE